MKLSPQWIRDFVDISVDDHRLAEDLTSVGIAAEGVSGSGADTVLEMEIGTNRPDAMNHYGVAREAAAIYEVPLKQISALSEKSPLLAKDARNGAPSASPGGPTEVVPFPIILEEAEFCPRFTARVIRGTRIQPSPEKIANRLRLLRREYVEDSAADQQVPRHHYNLPEQPIRGVVSLLTMIPVGPHGHKLTMPLDGQLPRYVE